MLRTRPAGHPKRKAPHGVGAKDQVQGVINLHRAGRPLLLRAITHQPGGWAGRSMGGKVAGGLPTRAVKLPDRGRGRPGDLDAPVNAFALADRSGTARRHSIGVGATAKRLSMVFQEHQERCNPLPLHQLGTMPFPDRHRRDLRPKPILSRGAAGCPAPPSARVTLQAAPPNGRPHRGFRGLTAIARSASRAAAAPASSAVRRRRWFLCACTPCAARTLAPARRGGQASAMPKAPGMGHR
jgi:hypothetical protein